MRNMGLFVLQMIIDLGGHLVENNDVWGEESLATSDFSQVRQYEIILQATYSVFL